jgi:hypothetical protein
MICRVKSNSTIYDSYFINIHHMKNNPYLDDSKLYLSATKNYKA